MQIKNSELEIDNGKVIGIGRIKFPKTDAFNHEIPLLAFIVTKEKNGAFVSTCIHFRIDGKGGTVEEAQTDMAENIWFFLSGNFSNENLKNRCWSDMYEMTKGDEISTVLWDKYHAVQFMLAERGVTTDKYTQFLIKIAELENKVRELEEKSKINKFEENVILEYITTEAA
jgi:hypothetical protein